MKQVLNNQDQSKVRQTKTSLAKKLGVSRGMLYYQPKREMIDEALKQLVVGVLKDHPSYGHKRIAMELKLNKKRILRVMKKFHLMPKKRRNQGFVKPDDLGKPETKCQNLIESFCPIRVSVVWVGDFTHIRGMVGYTWQLSWIYSQEK